VLVFFFFFLFTFLHGNPVTASDTSRFYHAHGSATCNAVISLLCQLDRRFFSHFSPTLWSRRAEAAVRLQPEGSKAASRERPCLSPFSPRSRCAADAGGQ